MHDDLLASKPEGASHNGDICPFCVEQATEIKSTVPEPSRSGGPDVSESQPIPEHGGRDTNPMTDMTKETHEALQAKAVADAVAATEQALATKTEEASAATARADKAEAELATAQADNARLNGELDTAQVSLKTATDKVTQLESDIATKDEAAAKAEIASKRAEQVKNLKLYDDTYVAERAEAWADLSDDDWASRLDEWNKIRPADAKVTPITDAASAMSGTSDALTKEPSSTDTAGETTKPTARRAVLGLS